MSQTISSSMTSTSTSSASASCSSITPGKDGYVPEWACNAKWNYRPNFGAAVFFSLLFGLTTTFHIVQAIRYKKIRLCWPLIMGAAWEFVGFVTHALGSKNQQSLAFAFASQILVLLAPMWVNAFVYMVLGRMIYFFTPRGMIWKTPSARIAKIFVLLDIISFIIQGIGSMMLTPSASASSIKTGMNIYMGGIGFQEGVIVIFAAFSIKFFLVMQATERASLPSYTSSVASSGLKHAIPVNGSTQRHWRKLLYVLWITLTLITVRIIFRLAEYSGGVDKSKNPIPFHEAYFLVLDALPMFIAMGLLNIVHPGMVLQGPGSEFPTWKETRAAKKIIKAAKKAKKDLKKAEKKEKKENKKNLREGIKMKGIVVEERELPQSEVEDRYI